MDLWGMDCRSLLHTANELGASPISRETTAGVDARVSEQPARPIVVAGTDRSRIFVVAPEEFIYDVFLQNSERIWARIVQHTPPWG